MTIRADGQFNTTVYNEDDRFRGIYGSRDVLLMNADDMAALGLAQGDLVTLETAANDGVERRLGELQVVPYDVPLAASSDTIRSATSLSRSGISPWAARARRPSRCRCASVAIPWGRRRRRNDGQSGAAYLAAIA
ncbi:hypothetical protein ACVWY2_004270 [Bradyrhizobium sp. JR6.1]